MVVKERGRNGSKGLKSQRTVCVFPHKNVIEAKASHSDDLGARAKDTMKHGGLWDQLTLWDRSVNVGNSVCAGERLLTLMWLIRSPPSD